MIWALAFFAVSSPLYADEESVTRAIEQAQTETNAFRGSATLNLRSSTTSRSDYDYRIFLASRLNLEYELKDLLSFGITARANKDLNNEYRATMAELSLYASRSFDLTHGFGLDIDASYGAPVVKDYYRYQNMKGTLGASTTLSYAFEGALTGLRLSGGFGYERYLYSYQYADGGEILTKWSLSQSFGLYYQLGDWAGGADFSNVSAWDFDGSQEHDSFVASEYIRYRINKEWDSRLGYINDGNTYDYGGSRYNVRFYDKRRSQVYVGTTYKF